ncbi:Aromatic/aminoadipate aminotransferase 1 [Irineochytrium annulatum]|nr:Aromatic/aminoadipate aminotransferase 1 [Irineochytrium annulatum]
MVADTLPVSAVPCVNDSIATPALSKLPTTANGSSVPSAAPAQNAKDFSHLLTPEASARVPSSLKSLYAIAARPGMLACAGGLPRPEMFAFNEFGATSSSNQWGKPLPIRVMEQPEATWSAGAKQALQYTTSGGMPVLIDTIKKYFVGTREPSYIDWDVIVTAGNSHAMDSCLRMFFQRGDGCLVSEFTYSAALEQMRPLGIIPTPVKMDHEGMVPGDLSRAVAEFKQVHPGAALNVVYVIPTGQNPTGKSMSVERRRELMDMCRRLDLFVLEDDPYSMLQMPAYAPPGAGRAAYKYPGVEGLLPTLASLDTEGRVIMMYTFSKVIAPGMRLGFCVASKKMCEVLKRYNEASIMFANGFSQGLMVELVNSWGKDGLERHAMEIQKHYTVRRDWLLDACRQHLEEPDGSSLAEYVSPAAGMFVWFRIQLGRDHPKGTANEIYQTLIDRNVLFVMGDHFKASTEASTDLPYYRIAFSYQEKANLETAVEIFGEVLREFGVEPIKASGSLSRQGPRY